MANVNARNVKEIIQAVGGKDNITYATHCVSRLRLQLGDVAKVDEQALAQIDLVKGTFYANDQFQVVIGQGIVDRVYDELLRQTKTIGVSKEEMTIISSTNLNVLEKLMKLLSDVFMPLLPGIVSSGLLLGMSNVLTGPGIFGGEPLVKMYPAIAGIAEMIRLIAGTAFAFLPALVSWSVVKRFGGNPLMGIILGLVLVNPALLNGYIAHSETPQFWHIFGLQIAQIGYQGQVLPALVAGFTYVKIETVCKRIVPDALHFLLVSTVSLLTTATLAFIIIGPITYHVSAWLTAGIVGLAHFSLLLTGLLFGGSFALLVLSGMHHAFLAVNMQLIATTGMTIFWPIQALSDVSQATAAFVTGVLSQQRKKASIAYSAAFSAYLGITEPAMFGVNLRTKYPFIAAMIGAACGGAFIGVHAVNAPAIGVSGLLSFLSVERNSWLPYIVGMGITIMITAMLTFVFHILGQKYGRRLANLQGERNKVE